VVLNFLWDTLETELRRHSRQAGFLYATERECSHWAIVQPFYKALGQIYKGAMTFCQANKKTKEGSLLDPSTFFKYRGRHSQFEKFWASAENSRRRRVDATSGSSLMP
jgi:hypothetical protein